MTEPAPPRLCAVCTKPLRVDERRTCLTCIGRARRNLLDIVEGYSLLPACMHTMPSPAPAHAPARGAGTPMPGGDALVLLGPGSEGRSDSRDVQSDDVASIAGVLTHHEDNWRHCFGWRAVTVEPAKEVAHAAKFLNVQMEKAATELGHFPEFAAEVKLLRGMVWRTTGQSLYVIVSPVPCFECGGGERDVEPEKRPKTLVREYDDATGLNDWWRCRQCDAEYSMTRYWLAVHEHLEEQAKRDAEELAKAVADDGDAA
jgi:hypothetical protein